MAENTLRALSKLKSTVQRYVEKNDDLSAYLCQQKVCLVSAQLYGQTSIEAERARLYCRELMIRSSPVEERVRLCQEYWRDAKEEYGENSDFVRFLAPLYISCCCEANEIEELRILCAEVVDIFCGNEDMESRELVALCADFDILIGEKSNDVQQLESACRRADSVFGRDSRYALNLWNGLGVLCRKNGELEKATEIHSRLLRISQASYGKYALDTIVFQRNYVFDRISSGHLRTALREAKKLKRAVRLCPDRNLCPDIYECFSCIYWGMRKDRIAEKYSRMSLAIQEGYLRADDLAIIKSRFMAALGSLISGRNDPAAFRRLVACMAAKEQILYSLYLLSSGIGREKYFSVQNRGEYDICLGVALSGQIEPLEGEDLLSLWEVSCNYKTLIGDCEFLHSATEKREDLAREIADINAAVQSADRRAAAEAKRRLLQLSKSADFPGYMNALHVRDIQAALGEEELLLDYYCVRFSDLQVYAAMAATRHSLQLTQLGSIDRVKELMEQTSHAIDAGTLLCPAEATGHQGNPPDSLLSLLAECLIPKIQIPKRVILCPDGELYHFAFDLLLGDAEIVYVTNPKDIPRGRNGAPQARGPVRRVNVFADPSFHQMEGAMEGQPSGQAGSAEPERSDRLPRLPGTLAEAEILKQIYGDRTSYFTRLEADRQTFLRNCNADILHLGTHADSENGGKIYLSGNPEEATGYLTPKDISALDMGGTRLAVLSACRTGIGEYRDYLGVRGLRRAFQVAGARAVIASLWNISDIPSAVLMYRFYSVYSVHGNCAAALHSAKRYLKEASVAKLREEVYPVLSDLLIRSGSLEAYREFRDTIRFGQDEEKPFSSPRHWAAFAVYDSFIR